MDGTNHDFFYYLWSHDYTLDENGNYDVSSGSFRTFLQNLSGQLLPTKMEMLENEYIEEQKDNLQSVQDSLDSEKNSLLPSGGIGGFSDSIQDIIFGSEGSGFDDSTFTDSFGAFSDAVSDTSSDGSIFQFFSQEVADSMASPSGISLASEVDPLQEALEYISECDERADNW